LVGLDFPFSIFNRAGAAKRNSVPAGRVPMSEVIKPENLIELRSLARKPELQETIQALEGFGESDWQTRTQWCDYSSFTLNDQKKIDDLIKIVEGEADGDFQGDDNCWVPVHAWRILATNQVEKAIPALVDLIVNVDDEDDWAREDLPEVIAMFGAKAIHSIRNELLESTIHGGDLWGHIGLLTTLGSIAKNCPETKDAVSELLIQLLTDFELHRPTLNSFLVSELVDLGDPAALPLIQKVFEWKLLDESVIDWQFILGKFSDVTGLPEKIKFEKYDINDFHYSGDDRFQKLLKSLDSAFNIEELKSYLMASHLAIDMVQPSAIIEEVLTNLLDQKTEFETEGQALYFYREFFGLWNHLTEFQTKPFELPEIDVAHISDFDDRELWSVIIFRTGWVLASFLDGLREGDTSGDRLKDGDAAKFMQWIEEKIDELETLHELKNLDVSVAKKLVHEIRSDWNKNYLRFASACLEVRRKDIQGRKFLETHKDVGRNEPCPCGSGKKFKKCCLEKYH
jgi:uncharacterized protein YecA (UPF0149 family)